MKQPIPLIILLVILARRLRHPRPKQSARRCARDGEESDDAGRP